VPLRRSDGEVRWRIGEDADATRRNFVVIDDEDQIVPGGVAIAVERFTRNISERVGLCEPSLATPVRLQVCSRTH
jgi:hypothetical protein